MPKKNKMSSMEDMGFDYGGSLPGSKKLYGYIPPMIKTLTNMQWHGVMRHDISSLVQEEYSTDLKGQLVPAEPILSRKSAFNLLAERYLRYIVSLKKFDECYKYMIHPQKRFLIINSVEGVIARLLELREEMVNIEQREFHFFDELLQTLNLTPDQFELHVPEVFTEYRAKAFRNRELILESILLRRKLSLKPTNEVSKGNVAEEFTFTQEEAILIIQRNQRGFMGRRKKNEMMRPYFDRMLLEKARNTGFSLALVMSGLKVKYVDKWKGFVQKKRIERKQLKEMVFLDMIPASHPNATLFQLNHEQHFRKKRKALAYEDDYLNERAILHDRILDTERVRLGEDVKYNIVQWLLETKDLMGKFPPFPEEDKGGSTLLFSNKTVAEVEDDIQDLFDGSTKKKPVEKDKKKDKKKEKKKEKPKVEEFAWQMPPSNSLPILKEVADTYSDYWYYRDEKNNLEQRHDVLLMKEEVRLEAAEKVRLEVDETMRRELERLTMAIEKTKENPKKKKKEEKKKEKKKKDVKDLTADRTIEELYEELVVMEIIKKTDHVRIEDFIGSHSFIGCAMQESGRQPMPSLADVKQLIIEQIIFPLGSTVVHQRAPLNRTFLIAGLRESGKKMLINAICYESGANLFDLTPSNLYGKYDDPEGRKMLMHLILKVGKALEPSVFLVKDCDAMFLKKKVKGDEIKAHKWEGILKKTMKKIKNGDRMMLIGLTNGPYRAKIGKMAKCFNRIILVPRPDYANRRELWKHFIWKVLGSVVFSESDVSVLTMVSSGYSAGAIKQACIEVLTIRRIEAIHRGFRLRTEEFVKRLAAADPIYLDEEAAFLQWYAKTPMAKKRIDRLEKEEMEAELVRQAKKKK